MCIILLHLHIGGVALIGPASDWLVDPAVPELESPVLCPALELPSEESTIIYYIILYYIILYDMG